MRLGDLVPELQTRGHPCWRKVQHKSEGAAEAHLRHLRALGKLKDTATANVFHCPHCLAWHVGHSSLKGTGSIYE